MLEYNSSLRVPTWQSMPKDNGGTQDCCITCVMVWWQCARCKSLTMSTYNLKHGWLSTLSQKSTTVLPAETLTYLLPVFFHDGLNFPFWGSITTGSAETNVKVNSKF